MRKIPTLFQRDPDDRRYVTDEVTPGCEWVLTGDGVPTRKFDGTCVMLDADGKWWARREVKPGRAAPANYVPVTTDEITGKTMGWEPVEQSSFAKFHAEAVQPLREFAALTHAALRPGTFELIGPKINGNPERAKRHRLQRHSTADRIAWENEDGTPGTTLDLIEMCREEGWEGVVWHHPDGRMVKLKVRDFR